MDGNFTETLGYGNFAVVAAQNGQDIAFPEDFIGIFAPGIDV